MRFTLLKFLLLFIPILLACNLQASPVTSVVIVEPNSTRVKPSPVSQTRFQRFLKKRLQKKIQRKLISGSASNIRMEPNLIKLLGLLVLCVILSYSVLFLVLGLDAFLLGSIGLFLVSLFGKYIFNRAGDSFETIKANPDLYFGRAMAIAVMIIAGLLTVVSLAGIATVIFDAFF